jgi:hypothetical protein
MFVETRTTVAEVLAEVHAEVNAMANSVINQAANREAHPTFNTKPLMRQQLNELAGMYQLASRVSGGHDKLSDELIAKVQKAFQAMRKVGVSTT